MWNDHRHQQQQKTETTTTTENPKKLVLEVQIDPLRFLLSCLDQWGINTITDIDLASLTQTLIRTDFRQRLLGSNLLPCTTHREGMHENSHVPLKHPSCARLHPPCYMCGLICH